MSAIFLLPAIFTLILFQARAKQKCSNSLCNYEAVCFLDDETPTCDCVEGFFKGDSCSEMIDHCNPNPCDNGGTCQPCLGHYYCECPEGYSAQKCSSTRDAVTGVHLHYNHIAPLGEEQILLLTVETLGTVETVMDFYTPDYIIDGGSFSSTTNHFTPTKKLSSLANDLGLMHSSRMPYQSGFYRISRATFWKLGVQKISLDLNDADTSEGYYTRNFNILIYDPTGRACLPVIRLPNCENPRQSLHIDIVTFNFIEPIVQQRCAEPSSVRINWSVRNYINSVVLYTFPEDASSTLTIPPYRMWFDYRDAYLQSYLVQGAVDELNSRGDVVSRTVLRCYIFVDTKKTQAQIIGGPKRKVNVYSSFVIDGSLSRDFARRTDRDQELIYSWSCTSNDTTNDYCLKDMGSGAKLSIPRNVLSLDSTYKYKLKVQSTINIYSTNVATQEIKPVTDYPLFLNFQCLRNCNELRFAAGKLIHLKVECLNCPSGELTYIIRDGSGAEVSTSHRVIITESTKSELSFEATATLDEREGTTSMKLKVIKPPTNGKCVVSPTSGTEYQTIFKISCPGYKDPRPISYTYKVGNSILDYGRNQTLSTRLFPTKGQSCEVTVNVCNDQNACTEDRLQVQLNPISTTGSWLEFLQQDESDLQKIASGGDRLAVNALIKAIIPHMTADEGIKISEYIVQSLRVFEVNRLLVAEQVLSMGSQLFDAVPLSSQSAVLVSELFAKVSHGLERAIRNGEVIELELEVHTQMLNDLTQAMAKATTAIEEFPTVHTAEVLPPEDLLKEDYPDYGELDVQEVVNISNWLQTFIEMHKCLQIMGVVSAFLQLPEETPIVIKKKGLTSKTLVVDTSERVSLSLSDMQTHVHLSPDILEDLHGQEIAVQFSVFETNPLWWYPDQYKMRTEILSLGAYEKDLNSLKSQSTKSELQFSMLLKDSKQPDDLYLVKGHVNGSLDMPVYEKLLPPNAVLIVKFLPPDSEIRVLLKMSKRPRSYMLKEAKRLTAATEDTTFFLVNSDSKPSPAYVAVGAEDQVNFTFTMSARVCLTFDQTIFDWTSEFCSVDSKTNATHIHCSCSHLSLFAAKIHPTFALLQPSRGFVQELTFNYTMMVTYLAIVIVLLILLFLAWRRDLTAAKGIVVLDINTKEAAPYKYLVTIYTNGHARASTSSNITIQLNGAILDSPHFALYSSPSYRLFQRNVPISFVVHSQAYLGSLQSVTLQHDNFGRSPSWNCHAVKVCDQTDGKEYMFILNEWFSKNESTTFPLTRKADLNRKTLIFKETLANEFANWYFQQVVCSQRLYETLSGTEKTAIFIVRVCIVLVGTMIVFGPTTMFTYEDERDLYYYMLLDFGKLLPIVIVCHLIGLIAAESLKYWFVKQRTSLGTR